MKHFILHGVWLTRGKNTAIAVKRHVFAIVVIEIKEIFHEVESSIKFLQIYMQSTPSVLK
jgi:hypothetical protein